MKNPGLPESLNLDTQRDMKTQAYLFGALCTALHNPPITTLCLRYCVPTNSKKVHIYCMPELYCFLSQCVIPRISPFGVITLIIISKCLKICAEGSKPIHTPYVYCCRALFSVSFHFTSSFK